MEPFKGLKPLKGLTARKNPALNKVFVFIDEGCYATIARIQTHCAKVQLPKQQL